MYIHQNDVNTIYNLNNPIKFDIQCHPQVIVYCVLPPELNIQCRLLVNNYPTFFHLHSHPQVNIIQNSTPEQVKGDHLKFKKYTDKNNKTKPNKDSIKNSNV